jgi:uroporphyrinogen-III synthase
MTRIERSIDWVDVCRGERLVRDRGVCALVGGEQVAIFRVGPTNQLYAISNYDPFSKAFVLSRGIVGSVGDVVKVASPVYKQAFDLRTGHALDRPDVRIPVYEVRETGGVVQVRSRCRPEKPPRERPARQSGPLAGFRIAICETRERERLIEMLESRGASVIPCPLVSTGEAEDPVALERWVREVIDGQMRACVFFTGEGARRIVAAAERLGLRGEFLEALADVETFTRGPKPARALRDVGILPTHTVDVPTSAGVLDALAARSLGGAPIGVQLYPRPSSRRIIHQLRAAGLDPHPVWPYSYEIVADPGTVRHLVTRLASGQIELIVFTSRAQVDALHRAAAAVELKAALEAGLRRTRIAAIGPVVASALRSHGLRPGIVPSEFFFMTSLVKEIVAASATTSAA